MRWISPQPALRGVAAAGAALLVAAGAALAAVGSARAAAEAATGPQPPEARQEVVKEGVRIGLEIASPEGGVLQAGDDGTVRFTIRDETTGAPRAGLHPVAWMDLRPAGEEASCKDKIQSFLQGTLARRPAVDLNSWYILILNQEGSVGVIDPLLGFGGQQLIAMPALGGRGEDWVLSRDGRRLFVTVPSLKAVSVVDTTSWKEQSKVTLPGTPGRIALQPDGRLAWVAIRGAAGAGGEAGVVVALDTDTLRTLPPVAAGRDPQAIAFAGDRVAAIADPAGGTVSLIDIPGMKIAQEVRTGPRPIAVAYSTLSEALYVLDGQDGTLAVVDPGTGRILSRLSLGPRELTAIAFSPDGRWGFIADAGAGRVHILDASSSEVVHAVEVGPQPYQIAFTDQLAYLRTAGSELVATIALHGLDRDTPPVVQRVSGGVKPPAEAEEGLETAAAIVPSPEGNAVLIANPADRMVYYYAEGMTAPMGSYSTERRRPRGVLVLDRSLRETRAGEYETAVRAPAAGTYDVALLLDSPRVWHCFAAQVQPGLGAGQDKTPKVHVSYLIDAKIVPVGETIIRLALTDAESGAPRAEVKDLTLLGLLAPGTWQRRVRAEPVGDGVYEARLPIPESGAYYVFVQSASLGAGYKDLPFLVLRAVPPAKPAAAAETEAEKEAQAQ